MDFEELVPERYRCFYHTSTKTFRVLDTWHQSIKNLNLSENPDIPEDSPALKILSNEEVNAVVGELIKLGWLDKMVEPKTEIPPFYNQQIIPEKKTKDLIVEKIAEITLDDTGKDDGHTTVTKDAISALKEIASQL